MLRGRTAKRIMGLFGVLVLVQGVVLAASLPRSHSSAGAELGLEALSQRAPDFRWEHVDGTAGSLSELRGHAAVIHFWATWCSSCREELPSLLDYADGAPVDVVVVSLDDRWPAVLPLVQDTRATVARSTSADAARAFGTRSVPETWLVDADGTLRARLQGPGDWTSPDLRSAVSDILVGAGPSRPLGPARPASTSAPADGCEFPEPPATEC